MVPGRTWTGGANLPTRHLRVNASRPLARLSIDAGRIEIRLRPRFAAKLFRADELSVEPGAVESVYRAVGKLFRGIGVHTNTGRDYYFSTTAAEDILAVAADAGFVVDTDPRVPRKIWNPMP